VRPITVAVLCVSLAASVSRAQSLLLVPTQYSTIQAAIAAAVPGDTVEVAPGTYVERIDFLGKAIVVRSAQGAAATIIDGALAGTVVTFANGETAASELRGFTIQNGRASVGGGIRCATASPTIAECVITGNTTTPYTGTTVSGRGAGIFLFQSNAYLTSCVVSGNVSAPNDVVTDGGAGGGLCLVGGGSLLIEDCTFSSNVAAPGGTAGNFSGGPGGAIATLGSTGTTTTLTVRRTHFVQNASGADTPLSASPAAGVGSGDGGALHVRDTVATFEDCVFSGNLTPPGTNRPLTSTLVGDAGHGGAIAGVRGSLTLQRCDFLGNTTGHGGTGFTGGSGGAGGAVHTYFTDIVIDRCRYIGNVAGDGAQGVTYGGLAHAGALDVGSDASDPASVVVRDTLFEANRGGKGGPSDLVTTFMANYAREGGAGACAIHATAFFEGCAFRANVGGDAGVGGSQIFGASGDTGRGGCAALELSGRGLGHFLAGVAQADVINCAFEGNTGGSGTMGAAGGESAMRLRSYLSKTPISACTFAHNQSGIPAAPVVFAETPVEVRNSIVWGNVPPTLALGSLFLTASTVRWSCVEGGYAGTGNIALDPQFVAPAGGDFRLACTSPCIDRGASAVPGMPATDLDGQPRVVGAAPDMGAYESRSGPLGGTADDFELRSFMNGGGIGVQACKNAAAGDVIAFELATPLGTFAGTDVFFLAQLFVTGTAPTLAPGSAVHLNPALTPVYLILGPPPALAGPATLSAGGAVSYSLIAPIGLPGFTARFQGLLISPLAANALYATTDAHDLIF
jgi:hypothetical protein